MVLERDCLQRMERLALPRGFVLYEVNSVNIPEEERWTRFS